MIVADLNVLPLGYTTVVILPRLYAIRPSRPHYEFMILFDFHAHSVKS